MLMNAQVGELSVEPFVDGELLGSGSDDVIDVVDPSTGRTSFAIPAGCDADVVRAVKSARMSFDDGRWSNAALSYRKKTLHRLADLIGAAASELDVLDAGEMGKPICVAFANAAGAASLMHFQAEAFDKISGDVFSSDRHSVVVQKRVPRGVVAAIVPWNFPTYNAVLKLGPALAAGNSVVLKPSELSSRSAIRLAQLAVEAGLPPGVLNVVPGMGETVGRALGLHGDVDMVTFTGSTEVGKRMLQYAGQSNMKHVMTECGGKSPHIVFDENADLTGIANAIADRLLTNQGQICSVGSRLLVEHSIEAELVSKVLERTKHIVMGDARDPKTTFGPLASAAQCARVMSYIETAVADGAHVVGGGRRALRAVGGYFVEPTILRNVLPSARIAQEEVFGPVLSVIPFRDEAEAARIANSTIYGLMAYVWTKDLSRAMRMSKAIRSSVRVNSVPPLGEGAGHATSAEPFGQSGLGVEGGLAGLESYLRRQLVWINHG